ncbi:hypothetical protein T484DRAFT_1855922 [Baffinella frigidus]|nr:hypothetical protein T484DRAFT_1855922 [Cryptophyta sp. CCMP2293]
MSTHAASGLPMGPPIILNGLRVELDAANDLTAELQFELSTANARADGLRLELDTTRRRTNAETGRFGLIETGHRAKLQELEARCTADKKASVVRIRRKCIEELERLQATHVQDTTSMQNADRQTLLASDKSLREMTAKYNTSQRSLAEADGAIKNHQEEMRACKTSIEKSIIDRSNWEATERKRMLDHIGVLDERVHRGVQYTKSLSRDISEKADLIRGMSQQIDAFKMQMPASLRGMPFQEAVAKETAVLNGRVMGLELENEMLNEKAAEQQLELDKLQEIILEFMSK